MDAAAQHGYHRNVPGTEVWLESLQSELARGGVVPSAWLLAAARVLPSTLILPAFGLAALPALARIGFAFILAASISPALALSLPAGELSLATALGAAAVGLPVAVGTAAGFWVATMAGNLLDALRGNEYLAPFAGVGSEASPLGVLLSLGAAVAFLGFGGPAALLEALVHAAPLSKAGVWRVAYGLLQGLNVAVLLAGPLLALTLVWELARALIMRAAQPGDLGPVLAPVRSLLVLAFSALLLDRMLAGISRWLMQQLGAT